MPFPHKIPEGYGVYTAPLKSATQKLDGYGGETIDRTHLTFNLDFCVPWRKRKALREEMWKRIVGGFLGRGDRLEYLATGDHPTSLRRLESSQSLGLSPS